MRATFSHKGPVAQFGFIRSRSSESAIFDVLFPAAVMERDGDGAERAAYAAIAAHRRMLNAIVVSSTCAVAFTRPT